MGARAVAAVLSFGLLAAAPADSAEQVPDRVMARGSEFNIVLSKAKLKPGRVIVQFVNAGEDPHDLRLQRVGDETEFGVGEIGPGEVESLDTRLKKHSTYVLWCSLSDHRQRGMEATLRTRKRRA
jgi:plastocyanin